MANTIIATQSPDSKAIFAYYSIAGSARLAPFSVESFLIIWDFNLFGGYNEISDDLI